MLSLFLQADFAASLTAADGEELQGVLESMDVEDRLAKALTLLKKERELAKLQAQISEEVRFPLQFSTQVTDVLCLAPTGQTAH